MKHNTGKIMMTVGLLLLAAALFLTGYNIWDEHRAGERVSEAAAQLPKPSEEAGQEAVLHPDMEMPAVEIDGRRYIGRVTIPSIGLDLPVLEQWSSANGRIAPCRYRGSAYSGDLILAGHNYRSHFGSLGQVMVGDQVLFTDVDGRVFVYTMASVEILDGTAVADMEAGDWDLSLFTCTYGGQTRLTLRCLEE